MKKEIVILSIILIMLSLIFTSIFIFKKEEEKVNKNISVILETEEGNIKANTFPSKDEYMYKETICNNTEDNVNINFNKETWKLDLNIEEKSVDGDFFCNIYFKEQEEYNFDYTGDYQTFTVPYSGTYKIELWGATRKVVGNTNKITYYLGAYTSGEIELKKNEQLYIYVGEQGKKSETSATFNGGGASTKGTYGIGSNRSQYYQNYPGAGATDVRLVGGTWNNFESLKSRIMVAAGTGGGESDSSRGGGIFSSENLSKNNSEFCPTYPNSQFPVYGATQTKAGYARNNELAGSFGIGGDGENNKLGYGSTGGGGGYYGGGGSFSRSWYDDSRCQTGASTGGSSFISGHNGCDAIEEFSTSSNIVHTGEPTHYSGKKFSNTIMIDGYGNNWTDKIIGKIDYLTPNGKKIEITEEGSYTTNLYDFSGNGYAKITFLNFS